MYLKNLLEKVPFKLKQMLVVIVAQQLQSLKITTIIKASL